MMKKSKSDDVKDSVKDSSKVKKIVFYGIEIIFVGLIIFSGFKLFTWLNNRNKSQEITNSFKDAVIINEGIDDSHPNEKYKVDFEVLKSKNKDTIAWIKVDGTKIEYPIVKAKNNEYYLKHSFDKSPNIFGWIFANYVNKFDGTDKNITIFGHGMVDGSMFGTLKDTLKGDWQKDKHYIILATENGNSLYETFSTYRVHDEAYFYTDNFKNSDEFKNFIKTIKERSNYDYKVDVDENDQILTLSTCDTDDRYRLILHAKKIKENVG